MSNPHFGRRGNPDVWGDTARAKRRRVVRQRSEPVHVERRCDRCPAEVYWSTDTRGCVAPLNVDGSVHLCEPDRVLRRLFDRDGETVLAQLRRTLNERRVHGAAV